MSVVAPSSASVNRQAERNAEFTRCIEGPVRVLVVEDNSELRSCVKEALEMRGYQVDTALDGIQAVESAFRKRYRVIVTDIRLPGMSGVGVIRSVKACRPEVKIIAITADPDWSVDEEARDAGAAFILRKPLDLKELANLIDFVRTEK